MVKFHMSIIESTCQKKNRKVRKKPFVENRHDTSSTSITLIIRVFDQ